MSGVGVGSRISSGNILGDIGDLAWKQLPCEGTRGKVLTRTADGQPEWMFGTHLDITARKAQEERLRKSEELLNRTGALVGIPIGRMQGDFRFSFILPLRQEMFRKIPHLNS